MNASVDLVTQSSDLDVEQYDVIVVGMGLSGLISGLSAQQKGARVVIVEKDHVPGGSTRVKMQESDPLLPAQFNRTPEIKSDLFSSGELLALLDDSIDWLVHSGLVEEENRAAGLERARQIAVCRTDVARKLAEMFVKGGGVLSCDTRALRLLLNELSVSGALAQHAGELVQIEATSVILCSGGFGANSEMLTNYLGTWGDRIVARCSPGSVGDGLRMALDVRAAASRGLARFDGRLIPASHSLSSGVAPITPTLRAINQGILINKGGLRFIDESQSESLINEELAFQTEATGFLIVDSQKFDVLIDSERNEILSLYQQIEAMAKTDATVRWANSFSELGDVLGELGVYSEGALAAITEYNEAVTNGRARQLQIVRTVSAPLIDHPPFAVVVVAPSLSSTLGGIAIDRRCQAIDRDGKVIAGLFAAGADSGGAYFGDIASATAWRLVTARLAANSAVDS